MNRWNLYPPLAYWTSFFRRARHLLRQIWLMLGAAVCLGAMAQSPPHLIPDQAPFAFMQVTQAPEVRLDAAAARLAPGARIYSPEKMLVLSASLAGQNIPVRYRLDPGGQVIEVWMLRPEEIPAFTGGRQNWSTPQEQRP